MSTLSRADYSETAAAPAQAVVDAPASRRRWLIAFILFLAVLSAFFDRISVAVLFTNKDFQDALALLWQILSGRGFPNQFFCDS